MRIRTGKTAATVTAAVLAGTCLLSPAPANAAPAGVVPMSATGCNSNVCMFLSSPSNGRVYIQAWAHNSTFYGNFDLTGPNGLYRHGSTQTWYAGSHPNVQQWDEAAVVGKYCVSGWRDGTRIGLPCETVG
jgi:hypothetical protein